MNHADITEESKTRAAKRLSVKYGSGKPASRTMPGTSYDGAAQGRLSNDWATSILSADAALRTNLKRMRARCRELERNEGYTTCYLDSVETNVLGHNGIGLNLLITEPDGKNGEKMDNGAIALIKDAWEEYNQKENFTVTGTLSGQDADGLILRSTARDGDFIIRFVRGWQENRFKFAVQLIEADYLDEEFNRQAPNGNWVRMGVEIDAWRKPVAYWLWERHPGDLFFGPSSGATFGKHIRVPAEDIILSAKYERADQTRGVPWMSSVMTRLNMLRGYEEAELINARVNASKMGFFIRKRPVDYEGPEDDSGATIMEAEPGAFETLPMGMEVQEYNPGGPNPNYDPYTKSCIRGIASGLRVSYMTLTGDLSEANYSSMRAGSLTEREKWMKLQSWYGDAVKSPIFREWLITSMLSGALNLPMSKFDKFHKPKWLFRRWGWVDPTKDVEANLQAIYGGLKSRSQVIAEGDSGSEINEVFTQIAEDKKLQDSLGLSFTVPIPKGYGTETGPTVPPNS